MKFLTKINRNYFLIFTIILILVSVTGYFVLRVIILNNTKEALLQKVSLIKRQINETGEIPNIYPIIEVKKINQKTIDSPFFKEIFIEDKIEEELEPFLEYATQIKIKDSFYSIKIRQSFFESEDLVMVIASAMFVLLFLSFGVSFFITKKLNKTIWADFEHLLQEIENYNFTKNNNFNPKQSNIVEFDRLNTVLDNFTKRLKSDYLLLKNFTENASHEIQTPISIVLLNLEEVLQNDISEDSFKKVVLSINALKRLSALNKSLILLSKIENRQFETRKTLNINDLINQKIQEFETVFETKKLKVKLKVESDFILKMDKYLAEILINNLISNAVNHNIISGDIQISIQKNGLKICNTGDKSDLTNDDIFNRFTKGNSNSYGLGLAIVKNICNTHNLEIHYHKSTLHCFTIRTKN